MAGAQGVQTDDEEKDEENERRHKKVEFGAVRWGRSHGWVCCWG